MDIQVHGAEPSATERDAVDRLLGAVLSGFGLDAKDFEPTLAFERLFLR